MSKIVYLIEQPLNQWNYDRLGIHIWLDRGWDVEVWDLAHYLHPRIFENSINGNVKVFDGYFYIASKEQLEHRYAEVDKPLYYVDCIGDEWRHARIKLRLAQIGVKRVVSFLGSVAGIPLISPSAGVKSRLANRLRLSIDMGPVKSFKWLMGAVLPNIAVKFYKPDLIVVGGEISIPAGIGKRKVLKAHNLDYDVYLMLKETVGVMESDSAVFIDQNLCLHSDSALMGEEPPASSENYYPAVCNALRKVSEALHLYPCVSGHPRFSNKHQSFFEEIPIKYGATGEQIRDCCIVVGHCSTAIQLAVIFEKPIIFVTTDELEASGYGVYIANFASELGKSVINIDRDVDLVDWQKELIVDHKKYADYRKKYIKMDGSPEKRSWDIAIDHIEQVTKEKISASNDG